MRDVEIQCGEHVVTEVVPEVVIPVITSWPWDEEEAE